MSVAEAISVKEHSQPQLQAELQKIKDYAANKDMKFNLEKSKLMVFNPTKTIFEPNIEIEGRKLEPVKEMKILGFTLTENLSWKRNTKLMVSRAYRKLWIVKRLLNLGASLDDLTDIFVKHVRSILEY